MKYETQQITYPNAVVQLHIPKLTEQERKKRMEDIKKAATELLKAMTV